ncbi:hypothetical protein chiPu_0008291 [Chiloscyllium punctatum]|uniref:Cadherin domain-containing protein n=1 Tax=Chiloscyllium punctatum TaxID=137246 RepID=A0A401SHF5_CHIPU|nr:hypothetical protein [Chiloscyllium punctatum]
MENGILVVNEKIDRETLCGRSASYFVSRNVTVENPLEMHRVDVKIRSDGSKIAELMLDGEQESTFHLTLTDIDGGIPRRSGTAVIVITVRDVNDYVPVFDH